jgi:transposase
MEACGAHYWAREIRALGHDVRLIPLIYLKPFVKRGDTDAADAEAISEAVARKTMRFVPVKSADQQAAAIVLKIRTLLVNQRPQVINALRGHLSELGIIADASTTQIAGLISIVRDKTDLRLPKAARLALMEVASQIDALKAQIEKLEQAISRSSGRLPRSRRLQTRPALRGLAGLDAETAFQERLRRVHAPIEKRQRLNGEEKSQIDGSMAIFGWWMRRARRESCAGRPWFPRNLAEC